MDQDRSEVYQVRPSRVGFVIVALLAGAMSLLGVYGLTRPGEQLAAGALVVFFGGFGALMAFAAVRPPVPLALDDEGAAFKSPPVMDRTSPDVLLQRHKHNFKVVARDVAKATIDAASIAHSHGVHVGRMSLLLADGKSYRFQFEDVGHLRVRGGHAAHDARGRDRGERRVERGQAGIRQGAVARSGCPKGLSGRAVLGVYGRLARLPGATAPSGISTGR